MILIFFLEFLLHYLTINYLNKTIFEVDNTKFLPKLKSDEEI